ncbi:hypothetical protein COCMIDRAFT_8969 [Bipolaris oryzae ATCC 44560]|uniref:Tf2-1-like SH3-like domain-containing protein n=1 Tax=Bipolaris oryzae ATCC 44560 TaxID=930090 RepID=W6YUQ4_COCMI|nr:uncharacterized protein COCMIDRAFT_8969 [Bipolaris oryzae ATCC 44560]EUC41288.1 hypothetical protein COCMIDRAFT_8969 [Bipolaris oryzae ATCC 44560]
MAIYYDQKHSPINIRDIVYLWVTRKLNKGYRIPHSSTLNVIKTGLFKVLERIGKGAVRLDLPAHIKIHLVVSIVHLSPAQTDPYGRALVTVGRVTEAAEDVSVADVPELTTTPAVDAPPALPTAPGEAQRYIVDRILTKELRRKLGTK